MIALGTFVAWEYYFDFKGGVRVWLLQDGVVRYERAG